MSTTLADALAIRDAGRVFQPAASLSEASRRRIRTAMLAAFDADRVAAPVDSETEQYLDRGEPTRLVDEVLGELVVSDVERLDQARLDGIRAAVEQRARAHQAR